MKVISSTFVKSALRPDHYPKDGRPEVAFVGRSNVGKSTMLNTLLNRKGLAKTSKTPGKTQTVNFFDVNGKFYFVDLPGYGYAKVSKAMQQQWARILTDYLVGRPPLRLIVQLVDCRHTPGANDHHLLDLVEQAEVPAVLVATKWDKLKASERAGCVESIRKHLELDEDALIIPFSSMSKEGVRALWDVIAEQVG
ncbi:MAG: ribosome biogenesis GTP-binding protein YihA/YsxC [Candidatus Hydrogenedentes bacterium]|nr:ribosome biogenesis GTP-binding protein YihA/YsxC [Candidatus Hydrogenedentota bacterium]